MIGSKLEKARKLSLYYLYFYEILKLSVHTAIFVWIGVASMAFYGLFAGLHIGSSLIVSLLALSALIFFQGAINLIDRTLIQELPWI